MGLGSVYIKLDHDSKSASDAFFTLNILLGILLGVLLWIISPLISTIYDSKILVQLIFLYAFTIVIRSVSFQPVAVLARSKRFDKLLLVNQVPLLFGILFSIFLAFYGFGVWALLVKSLVQAVMRSFLAYYICKRKYSFSSINDILQFKDSLKFGTQIITSRLIGGLYNSIDKFIFAKLYSVELLGQYSRAFNLARMPDGNIRMALSSPAIAHLARLAGYDQKLYAYKILTNIIFLCAGFPCMVFFLIGDKLLPWLMGGQWITAGIYLQVLSFWAIGQIFYGINSILVINEMQMHSWIKVNAFGIFFVYALPVIYYFIEVDPLVFIISFSCLNFVYWLFILIIYLFRITKSFKLIFVLSKTILISILVTLLVYFYKNLIWSFGAILDFSTFFSIFSFIFIFLIMSICSQVIFNYSFCVFIFKFLKK
jgi:O-antigen/teichoic acid export membrane protein